MPGRHATRPRPRACADLLCGITAPGCLGLAIFVVCIFEVLLSWHEKQLLPLFLRLRAEPHRSRDLLLSLRSRGRAARRTSEGTAFVAVAFACYCFTTSLEPVRPKARRPGFPGIERHPAAVHRCSASCPVWQTGDPGAQAFEAQALATESSNTRSAVVWGPSSRCGVVVGFWGLGFSLGL